MAASWTINPTTGVQDKGNGKFIFTPPITGSIKYTITYNDGNGFTGETEYTVKAGDCVTCDCSKLSFTKTKTDTIPMGGYDGQLGTYEITHEYCRNQSVTITATSLTNISSITVSEGKINGVIPANTGPARTASFKLSYNGTTCNSAFTFNQAAGCNCNDYSFSRAANIPYDDAATYTADLGTLKHKGGSTCPFTNVTFNSTTITNITVNQSTGKVTGTVTNNDGNPVTHRFSLKVNGSTCSSYNITQLGETRVCMVDNCANDDLFTNPDTNLHLLDMHFVPASASTNGNVVSGTCDTVHWRNAKNDYKVISIEYKDLDMYPENKYVYVDVNDGWSTVTNNELQLSLESQGCKFSRYCYGYVGCDYLYKRNPSNSKVRFFKVHWGWQSDEAWERAGTCSDAGDIPAGTHYKKDSWVIAMLAPDGYHWENGNPEHDDKGRHVYILKEGWNA